ncbi:MAG: Gfo/Idh/MocA family oxidoreductase [Spirochaetales bacterium]|nr:Gfo/Idh/MocA family oxidoreductase [Spirochaetales bacterium]
MKKIGIIGCGNIAPAYIRGIRRFDNVQLAAVSSRTHSSAERIAYEFDVPAVGIDELLSDDSIDIVVNLTLPEVHTKVMKQILDAGKHAYGEKPLAGSFRESMELLDLAGKKNLRIGCAPDTFLGAGHQTCRKLVDDGWIGDVRSGTAFMLSSGPESWHPRPHFFYQKGAGPLFDMGPYYLTALINLLGPVAEVAAVTSKGFETRTATSAERFGEVLPVDVPTHYAGVLVFRNGACVTLTVSFDVPRHTHSHIELYGTQGSMIIPDPNMFGGEVKVFRRGYEDWASMGHSHGYTSDTRGFGAADMALSIERNTPHRASGAVAAHVMEIMEAFEISSASARRIPLSSVCGRPDALPLGLLEGRLDR